ncbi:putative metallophosphoesterase [Iris pallida]|uniref:Metallophosphoesterase n=1 Tax=Iris pallida TaxID=29817 RepID=A0AAX6IKR5_IRIPA|nr:putative metallophosphoesterase [Iris pallida]KAJ6852985.1 putative metallophosphoesterase [Iris pallida]
MDLVVRRGGIDKRRVFDIRGNHDKYGVPRVGSNLDFFSLYSVNSQLHRLANIHSISLMGRSRSYIFLGIDDTMSIGIRGPSNLFGHPSDETIDAVEAELQYWNSSHSSSVTKVVFGHFPLSFTASSENGGRYEPLFARQSVAAYICGHLHAKFSKQLWRFHTAELAVSDGPKEPQRVKKQFWEWELGDWKEFRMIRILAVDEGKVSFLDMELSSPNQDSFQTTILITYPTDSRNMNHLSSVPQRQLLRNDINALVFSASPILNVTAKVLDSSRAFRIVEEVPLQPAASSSVSGKQAIFHAKWNAETYRNDSSAVRYWLQVSVVDSQGKETVSSSRPFSVEGKCAAEYPSTWLAFLVIGIRWEDLYSILLWSNICFLFILLSLPKILNIFMERSASYQKWAMSVSISSPIQQRRFLFSVLWFLIEGSMSRVVWLSLVVYLVYLLNFPWFWGYVSSENGDIAPMYMFGWRISSTVTMNNVGMNGNPDVMTVTLPFMYLVVTPLVLLIYSLFAERSAACLQCSFRKTRDSEQKVQLVAGAPLQSSEFISTSSVSRRTRRTFLLPACLVIACIHIRQCYSLMGAYGVSTVALSPAFSWVPPILLAAAICSTSKTW